MRFLPNGLGGSGGDRLVVNRPVYMSGDVWYVSSARGSASYDGSSYESPAATLAQAFTTAAAEDVIVLAKDHDEVVTSLVTLNKHITIVGEGSSAGKPMAKLQNNQAGAGLLLASTANVNIRNVYFKSNAQACSAATVRFTGQKFFRMSACYFECGANENAYVLQSGLSATPAQYITIDSTQFVCTTTAPDLTFTRVNGVGLFDVQDLLMRDCTFDGGTVGFESAAQTNLGLLIANGSTVSTRLYIEGLNLLRGADVTISNASAVGYLNTGTTTGANRVFW